MQYVVPEFAVDNTAISDECVNVGGRGVPFLHTTFVSSLVGEYSAVFCSGGRLTNTGNVAPDCPAGTGYGRN